MDFEKYTDRARGFVQSAQALAVREGHQQFAPEHLLKVLLDDPEGLASGLIDRADGRSREALTAVGAALAKIPKVSGGGTGQVYLAPALARVFDQAQKVAEKAGDSYVTVERLLFALAFEQDSEAGRILARAGVRPQNLNAVIIALRNRRATETAAEDVSQSLRSYTRDLTEVARAGKFDPVIGRDEEIRRAIQVLSLRTKNSAVLIGEPGVGKSAIVRGLVQRVVNGDVPDTLRDRKVMALDIGALTTGAKYRGEFEERLKGVLRDVSSSGGQIILFIDEIHGLVGGNSTEGTSEANLLKSALDGGELQFVATATPEGYKHVEKDAALARRLQAIFVSEPSIEDSISILRCLKHRFEQHHGVRVTDPALVAAATLSQRYRYATDRFLPDKAIDLIDEAAARLRIQVDTKPEVLDDLERQIIRLRIEREALKWEHDEASNERMKRLENELTTLEKKAADISARWRSEKENLWEAQKVKTELDQLRVELANAQRKGEYQRAGELAYARIPELEMRLIAIEAGDDMRRLGEDHVTAYHVADVIARVTGVPADQILKGEPGAGDTSHSRPAGASSRKIFISYRRDDSAGHAGRVHDRLEAEFGRDLLFMDVDSIPLGADFVKILREAVSRCDVLLAVIGPKWLDVRGESGGRRLDDPSDFVRIEIAVALERDIPVIPILLDGAGMPRSDQLPEDIKGFALRQGLEVHHVSFRSDVDKLIKALRSRLAPT
jgi:ATP-dependent Clp protease ATP-binding subunit ClpB